MGTCRSIAVLSKGWAPLFTPVCVTVTALPVSPLVGQAVVASRPRSPGRGLPPSWVPRSPLVPPTARPPPLPSVAQVRVWLRGAVSLTVMHHLASRHRRVKRSSFSRAWRREAGRQPTPPRRGPGTGNSHPGSTPGNPHPELKRRGSRTGGSPGFCTVSLARPLPLAGAAPSQQNTEGATALARVPS